MKPRLSFTSPRCAVRAARNPGGAAPSMSGERLAGRLLPGLVLAAALALGAGDAAAQQRPLPEGPAWIVHPDHPATCRDLRIRDLNEAWYCPYGRTETSHIVVQFQNPAVRVLSDFESAIEYLHEGVGNLEIWVSSVDPTFTIPAGADAPAPAHPSPTDFDHGLSTDGDGFQYRPPPELGAPDPDEFWGYASGEDSHGIYAKHTGSGRVGVSVRDTSIRTAGEYAHSVYVWQQGGYIFVDGAARRAQGAVVVDIRETERDRADRVRPRLATGGVYADAIRADYTRGAAFGHIAVTIEGYAIATGDTAAKTSAALATCQALPADSEDEITARNRCLDMVARSRHLPEHVGLEARGVLAKHGGLGDIRISVTDSEIATTGESAQGIYAEHVGRTFTEQGRDGSTVRTTGGGDIAIGVTGGRIVTAGEDSHGVHALHWGVGGVDIDLGNAAIETTGRTARGVLVHIGSCGPVECSGYRFRPGTALGPIAIDVAGGSISTTAGKAYAIQARHEYEGNIAIRAAGGAALSTMGEAAHAVFAEHLGSGGEDGVTVTIAGATIATAGSNADGVRARHDGADGSLEIRMTDGTVAAAGSESIGLYALRNGAGGIAVTVSGGAVTSNGADGIGVVADGKGDIAVNIGRGATVSGSRVGIDLYSRAGEGSAPTLAVSVDGTVTSSSGGGIYLPRGAVTIAETGIVRAAAGNFAVYSDEAGELSVTVRGRAEGDILANTGTLVFALDEGATVTGTVWDPTTADSSPMVIRGTVGRIRYSAAGAVTIAPNGRLTGVDGEAIGNGSGELSVTVQGRVEGDLRTGPGTLTFASPQGGTVTGTVYDPAGELTVNGSVGRILYTDGGAVTVAAGGVVTGVEAADGSTEAVVNRGGNATVAIAGKVTGAVKDTGDGNLTVTVRSGGELGGDIHALGEGTHAVTVERDGRIAGSLYGRYTLNVMEGGEVVGAIFDPEPGTSIGGTIAAVRYTNGGSIAIAATGRVIGVDIPGAGRRAIHSAAGNLTVDVAKGGVVESAIEDAGDGNLTLTVSGEVKGNVIARRGGTHEVTVRGGGKISGAALFDRSGAVTVEAGGTLAGADGVAARSGSGDLTATVAGRAEGGLRADRGALTLAVAAGGTVTGTAQARTGEATVAGSVARIVYAAGGSVTVAAGGAVAGVTGEADAIRSEDGDLTVAVAQSGTVAGNIRSRGGGDLEADVGGAVEGGIFGDGDGDLDVKVSGTVGGGIFGLGAGEHNVHVMTGGEVSGMIHLAASTVKVDGKSGPVLFDNGGEVEVGAGGRISGTDSAAAIRSLTGDLTIAVANMGTVSGDITGRGAGEHGLTVAQGGSVTGTVDIASGRIVVDGSVGRVRLDSGSALTVGESGRIVGVEGQTIVVLSGEPEVVVVRGEGESLEDAIGRIGGREGIVETGGKPKVLLRREGEEDVLVEFDPDGTPSIVVPRVAPPRPAGEAVYESMPSVLMALTALPEFGGALASAGARGAAAARYELAADGDMAVGRASAWRGAWARVHAGGGDRRHSSSAAGGGHDIRRYAFEAGMEGAPGDNALVSVSVHHVQGEADIDGSAAEGTHGGGAEISGTGARVAGAWFPEGGYYVGGQAAATLYEADLTSADPTVERGVLKRDVSGRGYEIGAEAGRRFDIGRLAVTPRARINWSRVDMSSFTDERGSLVSVEGRSVKARAGVRVETGATVGGLFATVDLERELSGTMRATVASSSLEADAETTWARFGLGGAHEWAGGRFVLRGDANYAAAENGNRDFGGSASLTVRF